MQTSQLKEQIKKYLNYTIIVEGKNDVLALKSLGFEKVFAVHKANNSINNALEKITINISKKDKICILTDSDKRGKQLFAQIRKILETLEFKTDSKLRSILQKEGISHVEGLNKFINNQEN